MTHDDVKQWLTLPVEELDEAMRGHLEDHLASCVECRQEAALLQRLHDEVRLAAPVVTDEDLMVARHMLFRTLRQRSGSARRFERLMTWLGLSPSGAWKPALAATLIAVAAFGAGTLAFRAGSGLPTGFHVAAYDFSGDDRPLGAIQVLNLRILNRDESSGDIEFEFEAVQPLHVKGNMRDPGIQAILARALVSSQNPGVRLRAANVIGGQVADRQLDRRSMELVKESLISALLYDQNRGVRMEALKALQPFLPDSAATAAIVQILKREENVAMRIAAINSLDLNTFGQAPAREQVESALRDRSMSDANNYIRIRAAAALQEE
jgi:hypothetical protein